MELLFNRRVRGNRRDSNEKTLSDLCVLCGLENI